MEATAHSAAITGSTLGNQVSGMGEGDRSPSEPRGGNPPSTEVDPVVETPQQYQTQFGDSAYSKAVTERLAEESNQGKP
jgi:hypothetical protein